jgi:site-specific recombinase XerD
VRAGEGSSPGDGIAVGERSSSDTDRPMVLFASQCEALKRQLQHVRLIHQQDLATGGQWVFPRRNRWKDATWKEGRNHLDPSMVKKAVKKAVESAGFAKLAGCHPFRHSFTTHLLERGQDQ